jgi:GntR family transcriptional regulator
MTAIERESPVPLYHQLKQLLTDRIANGDWQPGDMLPTEEQLQEQYGLSRTTVRQALRELEYEEKISRYPGRGTFVTKPKISHSPDPEFDFTTFLTQQGMRPSWRVLSIEWVPASAQLAERLTVTPETLVYQLRRLRLANDEPIGYHTTHVIPSLGENIDEQWLEQGDSLDYLRKSGQLVESYANRIIEAVLATEQTAKLLDVVVGSPILLIRRRVFDSEGTPVEDMRASYRGDRFQYRIRLWPGA